MGSHLVLPDAHLRKVVREKAYTLTMREIKSTVNPYFYLRQLLFDILLSLQVELFYELLFSQNYCIFSFINLLVRLIICEADPISCEKLKLKL